MINLKEILYDYAYTKGGGLPLTPQEVCNAVVQWVQKYLEDKKYVKELSNQDHIISLSEYTNASGDIGYNVNINVSQLVAELDAQFSDDKFLDAFTLNEKIVGSNSVVVDISEDSKKLVIKVDEGLMDRVQDLEDRAILKPVSLTEESVPVVNMTGDVSFKPVSEIGGGGLKLYTHNIQTGGPLLMILSTKATAYTLDELATDVNMNMFNHGIIYIVCEMGDGSYVKISKTGGNTYYIYQGGEGFQIDVNNYRDDVTEF